MQNTTPNTSNFPATVPMVLYRFGFNGQVKDNEVYGAGNAYSAMFWEYDARLGRRWNVDPIFSDWESRYACFANNPVFYVDPLGLSADGHGGDPGKKRYKNRKYVKRKGADNKVENSAGEKIGNSKSVLVFMRLRNIFSGGSHSTNRVPSGRMHNDPLVYTASHTASQGNENYYHLDQVNPESHLRHLWYEGTRSSMLSPAYIDVDALMPGGYYNLFNSNAFAILPNFLDPDGNLASIGGTAQYIGGLNTLFRNGIGMGLLSNLIGPKYSNLIGAAVILQCGVNPAYSNVSNIRTTSYITMVNNITVSYMVRRHQYFANSSITGPLWRPRWHRWLYGQPDWSTR